MNKQNNKTIRKEVFKLLGIFSIFLVVSCGNIDNIEIGEPKDIKIQGFEDNYLKVSAKIPVKNPSNYKIAIKDIDLRVHLNGNYMGKLIIDKTIQIKRKENREYDLPIKIRLSNPLGAALIVMNMKQGQNIEIRLEGEVKAKSMLLTRNILIDETKRIVL